MLKNHIKMAAVILTLFSSINALAADNLGECTYPKGLKNGLNMASYESCVAKINSCPKNGPYLDGSCAQQTAEKEATCKELNQLAEQMSASPELVHVKNVAGFSVIDMSFPADNGHQYAILSPKGCFIDTVIDPRDMSETVQSEFAKNDFYLEAKDAPHYLAKEDGSKQFTIDILAKNQCRACEVIGTATFAFNFSKNGTWSKTELVLFEKN